jgi:acyl carrier protein
MQLPGPTVPEGVEVLDAQTQQVLDAVRTILADVIGEDYVQELDIDMDTTFHDDLDIESIEFVALGEALTARYGDRVDLAGWIASMQFDEIIDMKVGRLVKHIASSGG